MSELPRGLCHWSGQLQRGFQGPPVGPRRCRAGARFGPEAARVVQVASQSARRRPRQPGAAVRLDPTEGRLLPDPTSLEKPVYYHAAPCHSSAASNGVRTSRSRLGVDSGFFERTFPMDLLQRLKDSKGSSLKKESHELTGDPDKPPSAPGVRAIRLSSPRNREIRLGNSAVLRQGRSWTREPARRGLERRGTTLPPAGSTLSSSVSRLPVYRISPSP